MNGERAAGSRIVIVGPAVSGKSTLARRLGLLLHVPVVELDALYWKPGWVSSSDEEFRDRVVAATAEDSWVVDGHYERIWPALWPRAQTVVWLDLPLRTLLWRGLARSLRRMRTHEVLWGTNRESIWHQLNVWDADRSLLAWGYGRGLAQHLLSMGNGRFRSQCAMDRRRPAAGTPDCEDGSSSTPWRSPRASAKRVMPFRGFQSMTRLRS